jgi:hypothetical protein
VTATTFDTESCCDTVTIVRVAGSRTSSKIFDLWVALSVSARCSPRG